MDEARNYVADAINQLGGVTAAVEQTGISASTWFRWRQQRRIASRASARLVATLTEIPVDLLGRRKVRARPSTSSRRSRKKRADATQRAIGKRAA